MDRYEDMINRNYTGIVSRRRMSLENRAAQFAPFAALTGHDDAINETARLTSERVSLSEEEQRNLSERLRCELAHIENRHSLTFTVFRQDPMKTGGSYVRISGVIKKYEEYGRLIFLTNGKTVSMDDIIFIDGDRTAP